MAKIRKTDLFRDNLLKALHPHLPGEWTIQGAHSWRLVQPTEWGYCAVGPVMETKWLPQTTVTLSYGVAHTSLDPIFRRLRESSGFEHLDVCKVRQDTYNGPLIPGKTGTGVADYNRADFPWVAADLLEPEAVESLFRFYKRFSDLREIRRSLDERDNAFTTFGETDIIVAIDVVLDDLDHLRNYRERCKPRYHAKMVDDALGVLGITL